MAAAFYRIRFLRPLQLLCWQRRRSDDKRVEWLEVLAAGIEIWPPAGRISRAEVQEDLTAALPIAQASGTRHPRAPLASPG